MNLDGSEGRQIQEDNVDDRSFDDLAKAVGAGTPRRTVLKTLAGGALGVVIASIGAGEALASTRKRSIGNICARDADCLAGNCVPTGKPGRHVCGCPPSLQMCGNGCLEGSGTCAGDIVCCNQYQFCADGQCFSCFVAGTRIAMPDGSSRYIEDVRAGDFVLGSKGQANRVARVEMPLLGGRSLYAVNGGRMFVTAEHPFATEDGWKAIDPAATARENADLPVGRLAVGDRLLALASVRMLAYVGGLTGSEPAAVRLKPVALTSLEAGDAAPDTQLYNLLLDGDHAYFADELLVHNKG